MHYIGPRAAHVAPEQDVLPALAQTGGRWRAPQPAQLGDVVRRIVEQCVQQAARVTPQAAGGDGRVVEDPRVEGDPHRDSVASCSAAATAAATRSVANGAAAARLASA